MTDTDARDIVAAAQRIVNMAGVHSEGNGRVFTYLIAAADYDRLKSALSGEAPECEECGHIAPCPDHYGIEPPVPTSDQCAKCGQPLGAEAQTRDPRESGERFHTRCVVGGAV